MLNKQTFKRSALVAGSLFLSSVAQGIENQPFPLGGIGATALQQQNTNAFQVKEVTVGSPGEIAGLQVGDYIYGINGQQFEQYGGTYDESWVGPTTELGYAMDTLRKSGGTLSLMVLRAGSSALTVDVSIAQEETTDILAHSTNSVSYQLFLKSCAQIHTWTQANGGGGNHNHGWYGLILLAHADWNNNSGATPYGLSVERLRDDGSNYIMNSHVYDPATNNGEGSSNWHIGQLVMFLSEYRIKVGSNVSYEIGSEDQIVTIDEVIQRGSEILRNYIQDGVSANQKSGTFSTGDVTNVRGGHTGHGGFFGEYAGNDPDTETGGFNITLVHLLSGLSWASRTNADFTASQTNCFASDGIGQSGWSKN